MACLGRLETIFSRIRLRFNEGADTKSASGFLKEDSNILIWMNECVDEIAKTGYWATTDTIDLESGTGTYSLEAELTEEPVRVYDVRLTSTGNSLIPCTNRTEIANILAVTASGTPEAYIVYGDTLELAPVPDTTTSGGLTVFHSYHPGYLDCSTDYTPEIPQSHDNVFTYYGLWCVYQQDRLTRGAENWAAYYWDLFRRELDDLLGHSVETEVRPYR